MAKGDKKRRLAGFPKGNTFSPRATPAASDTDRPTHATRRSTTGWREPAGCDNDFSRLPQDVYEAADTRGPLTPSILRPRSPTRQIWDTYNCGESGRFDNISGNRLVNMSKMAEMISEFYRSHMLEHPGCDGDVFFPADEEMVLGLASKVVLKCKKCCFISNRYKLYEEIERQGPGTRKPTVNVQLAHYLSKSPISINDVRLLFGSIDSTVLSESAVMASIKCVAPVWEQANKRAIQNNRVLLQNILCRQGQAKDKPVDVCAEADTSYATPPKGRSFSQPSKQSVTPLLENHTKSKMVIGLTSFNQHCPLGRRCDGREHKCPQTFPILKALDKSEAEAAKLQYIENATAGLQISDLTHDGTCSTSKHYQGMKTAAKTLNLQVPASSLCTVHLSRATKRKVFSASLTPELIGSSKAEESTGFRAQLGRAIDKRCALELRKAYNIAGAQDTIFYKCVESARTTILDCFSGNHSACPKSSNICTLKKDDIPYHLPHSQYLHMAPTDRVELQKIIDHRLSHDKAKSQRHLRHTNKSESFHLRTLKATPKNKTCKRHYAARNHSAAHNASVGGCGNSILELNEITKSKVQKGSKSLKILKSIDDRAKYHAARQKAIDFKYQRKVNKLRELKLKQLRKRNVVDGTRDSLVAQDHNYMA